MKKRISLAICCAALALGMTGITAMAQETTVNKSEQLKVMSDEPIVKEDEEYTITNEIVPIPYPLFKPTVDGFYTIQKTYLGYDGITFEYAPHLYNDGNQDHAYMTSDNPCKIEIDISQAKYCKFSLSRVTDTITAGTHNINVASDESIFTLLNVTENQTCQFTANVTNGAGGEGDIDIFVYSKDGYMNPASGYNEYYYDGDTRDHDWGFNCTYNFTPGSYLVRIYANNKSVGTYTITHSKHTYVKDTKSDGTYEMKCACGQVNSATSHKAHKFVTGENTATALAAGSITKTCSVCGYKTRKSTPRLTPTIKLSATNKSIKKKKSFTLKISNLAKGDRIVSVVSKKKTIATVKKLSKAGNYKITGKKKGTTKLVVKLKSGKTATCTVKVK